MLGPKVVRSRARVQTSLSRTEPCRFGTDLTAKRPGYDDVDEEVMLTIQRWRQITTLRPRSNVGSGNVDGVHGRLVYGKTSRSLKDSMDERTSDVGSGVPCGCAVQSREDVGEKT